MALQILLIDDSLTVQKVVALTLDEPHFEVRYAKSRGDAMRAINERPVDVVLLGDNVADIQLNEFSRELESWVPPSHRRPPILLICGPDEDPSRWERTFDSVIQKPFSPSTLLNVVKKLGPSVKAEAGAQPAEGGFESMFNDAFSDEASLVNATFANHPVETHSESAQPMNDGGGSLWGVTSQREVRPSAYDNQSKSVRPDSMHNSREHQESSNLWGGKVEQKNNPSWDLNRNERRDPIFPDSRPESQREFHPPAQPQNAQPQLSEERVTEIIESVLDQIVPPIVERLVEKRLDALLNESEAANIK